LALFVVVWGAALWLTRPSGEANLAATLRPVLWPVAGLFLLWAAGVLPAARMAFILPAAALFLGVWPLGNWRAGGRGIQPEFSIALGGLPVVAGASILSSGLSAALMPPVIAVATALGLLSLVAGLARAWGRTQEGLAVALGVGLAGPALAAAVWAGEEALVAAVRLAVFAPAVLTMLATVGVGRPSTSPEANRAVWLRRAPGLTALAVVYLAVGGVPLTAGFAALSRLYDAWQLAGGYVLLALTASLITLWLAAIYRAGRAAPGEDVASDRVAAVRGLALLTPLLGLVSPSFTAPAGGALVWAALAAPPVAGALLGRFAPGLDALDDLLRESVAIHLPSDRVLPRLRGYGRVAVDAVADALAILEGEYGLLWLLGLLLLLQWIA
jgi:hypothetical protein